MKSGWLSFILILSVLGGFISVGFVVRPEYPLLFWFIEGLALVATILFVILYRTLLKPHQLLLRGVELLKAQDFSSRLRLQHNSEANRIIEVFNIMMSRLKNEHLHLREKNHFLDLLIEASPQGVIILDFDEYVTQINPAGLKLLRIKDLSAALRIHISKLQSEFIPGLAELKQGDDTILHTSDGSAYRCIRSSFMDMGFDHPFILIEELTHELMQVEKASYERIIRMMSHEVNNSVGAISATLNVVSDMIRQEPDGDGWSDILPAVDASFERSGHLAQFIKNLANVVKVPEPSFSDISLRELVRSVKALTTIECSKRNIQLTSSLPEEDIIIRADGIQLEQVIVNVIKNSWEAIGGKGEIRLTISASPLTLTIEDNGPGMTPDVQKTLFTSFFTTKATGYGMGLMFVREVLNNHNYKFSLSASNGWTQFKVFFE